MVFLARLLTLSSLSMVFFLALTNTLLAQTRSDGREQTPGTSQGSYGQQTAPTGGSSGRGPAWVVPYISVSERYDSNILYTPTNKLHDYVTAISPGARLNYRDDMVIASLRAGLTSEVYVRNPGLNYIGTNAAFNAVLDNAIGKVVRGLGLSISNTMAYTPRPQPWLTPDVTDNVFISGIQTYRNNQLTNVASATSTYMLNPSDEIKASYSYQMIRFYNRPESVSGPVGGLFNTDVHTFSTGFDHHINATDLVGVSYQYQHMSFEPNTGGPSTSVEVNHAIMTWKKAVTREVIAQVSPGGAILSSLPGEPQWTMLASLEWRDPLNIVGLSYNRFVSPGFFVVGSARISDVVALSLMHNLTTQWSVTGQANYSSSNSLGAQSGNLVTEGYGARTSLNYTFYPGVVASTAATYDRFTFDTGPSASQIVNRLTAMLSLTAEWN